MGSRWRPFKGCDQSTSSARLSIPANPPCQHARTPHRNTCTHIHNQTARPTAVTSIITDHIAKLIPPFPKPFRHVLLSLSKHRISTTDRSRAWCSITYPLNPRAHRHNKNDNFVMYLSEEYAYSNLDAAYLLAIGHQGFLTPGGACILPECLTLTAVLPTSAPAWMALALTASLPVRSSYSRTYPPACLPHPCPNPFAFSLTYPPADTLLAKVTGVLPITARNVEKDPKIANWQVSQHTII